MPDLVAAIHDRLAGDPTWDDLAATVTAVVEQHGRPRTDRHGSGCIACGVVWPCPTLHRIAENLGAST